MATYRQRGLVNVPASEWLVSGTENGLIDDVERLTNRERRDLVENIRELDFVFFAGNVAYMRRADNVVHRQERVKDVLKRLLLEDVHGGHARTALLESTDEGAGFN
jgi:hypothetical protein